MYEVYIERNVEHDLRKVSQSEFTHITRQIKSLSLNPPPIGCRKIVGTTSDWRIRVGRYRVIYEINDKEKSVRVFRVRHRREAYR